MNRAKIKNALIVTRGLLEEASQEHMELMQYEINALQEIVRILDKDILHSFDENPIRIAESKRNLALLLESNRWHT